jgi:hypothetical protein
MGISKDDAGDLKSLHERVIETALTLRDANAQHVQAVRDYESLLLKLQAPEVHKESE